MVKKLTQRRISFYLRMSLLCMYITVSYSCWQSGHSVIDMARNTGNRSIIDQFSRWTAVSSPNVNYRRGRSHFHVSTFSYSPESSLTFGHLCTNTAATLTGSFLSQTPSKAPFYGTLHITEMAKWKGMISKRAIKVPGCCKLVIEAVAISRPVARVFLKGGSKSATKNFLLINYW